MNRSPGRRETQKRQCINGYSTLDWTRTEDRCGWLPTHAKKTTTVPRMPSWQKSRRRVCVRARVFAEQCLTLEWILLKNSDFLRKKTLFLLNSS